MTTINIFLRDNRCFLTTDTLAGNFDGTKHRNVNKVYPMPGYHSILIGTGDGRLIFNWYCRLNQGTMQSLYQGREFFPEMIRKTAESCKFDRTVRTDILHISYDQVVKVDLFSSQNNFEAEDVHSHYFSPHFSDELNIVKQLRQFHHKGIKNKMIELAKIQHKNDPSSVGGFCVYIEANAHRNCCEISSDLLFEIVAPSIAVKN